MARQERSERLRSPEQRVGTLPNADIPPPSTVDDEVLLRRAFVEEDERAFELALDRLFPPMIATATRYVRTRADAEDVVQEAWLAALRGFHRFQHRSSIRTWLFRILRYRAMTHGRNAARVVPFSQIEATEPGRPRRPLDRNLEHATIAARLPDPERALDDREIRDRVDQALETLPSRQREVFVLRDIEGWTAPEVRTAMGLTDANQRVLLHRARSRLRTALDDYARSTN